MRNGNDILLCIELPFPYFHFLVSISHFLFPHSLFYKYPVALPLVVSLVPSRSNHGLAHMRVWARDYAVVSRGYIAVFFWWEE